jgi:hypothetical protein
VSVEAGRAGGDKSAAWRETPEGYNRGVSPKSIRSPARAGLGALLIAAACNSSSGPPRPPSISVARYDQACATIADCAFVYDGPANCCGVGCANAAIAQRALAHYTSDLASAERAACAGTSGVCSMGARAYLTGMIVLSVRRDEFFNPRSFLRRQALESLLDGRIGSSTRRQ